jgi:hypothetical protein
MVIDSTVGENVLAFWGAKPTAKLSRKARLGMPGKMRKTLMLQADLKHPDMIEKRRNVCSISWRSDRMP